jgi:hypothetical protein
MSDTFTIKRRDNLPVLRATLYTDEAQTVPVDLTNASVVLVKVGKVNQAPTLTKSMTILTPRTSGRVEHQFTTTDTFVAPDDYSMEFEVTWNNGDVSTYPKQGYKTFRVVADLDQEIA